MTPDQLRSRRQAGVPDRNDAKNVDPTENVKALMAASLEAVGKFRESDKELSTAQYKFMRELLDIHRTHEKELASQREAYQEKLARAESGRLDSIRQVDREEVAKTAVAANTAIQTLAKQTTDLQQTLAKQVTDTATAQESRNTAQYTDTNKRLSALELSSSEGKGKQTVVDPQIEKLTALVETLARTQNTSTGKAEGSAATWAAAGALIGLIISVIGFAFVLQSRAPQATAAATPPPVIIEVPVPAPKPATVVK